MAAASKGINHVVGLYRAPAVGYPDRCGGLTLFLPKEVSGRRIVLEIAR